MCTVRIVVAWVGAVLVLAGAIVAGVAVANATVFSASGFVRDYLTTLADGRVEEVLALPGVDTDGLDERMLHPRALESFSWQVVAETSDGGVHGVTVTFEGQGLEEQTTLQVERIGTRYGLFPEWGFARSPVTELSVTARGDTRLTVGEVPLELEEGGPERFAVLTPGIYVFAHESDFLTADEVTFAATGGTASVEVEITPSEAFLSAAQRALDEALRACTEQRVLFPTGCPFGFSIQNRVASEPQWSIDHLPDARLEPGDEIGSWTLTGVEGVAVLRVDVQSLFDGSVSTLEREVPFSAAYLLGFEGDTVVVVPDASAEG